MSKRSVQDTYLAPAEKALGDAATYTIDYTEELADQSPVDTVVGSSWAITGSVTQSAAAFTTKTTSVRVSGGTKIGTLHRLVNTVTTANGDTLVRVLTIKIVNIHAKRPDERTDVTITSL
jgi:hypothetical protein